MFFMFPFQKSRPLEGIFKTFYKTKNQNQKNKTNEKSKK